MKCDRDRKYDGDGDEEYSPKIMAAESPSALQPDGILRHHDGGQEKRQAKRDVDNNRGSGQNRDDPNEPGDSTERGRGGPYRYAEEHTQQDDDADDNCNKERCPRHPPHWR